MKIIIICIILLLTGCSAKEQNKKEMVDNITNIKEIVGTYIADGTQICFPVEYDKEGKPICQDPNPSPYIIEISEDSKFTLTLTEYSINGKVEYNKKENIIYFNPKDNASFSCTLAKEELNCQMYAKKFIKSKDAE